MKQSSVKHGQGHGKSWQRRKYREQKVENVTSANLDDAFGYDWAWEDWMSDWRYQDDLDEPFWYDHEGWSSPCGTYHRETIIGVMGGWIYEQKLAGIVDPATWPAMSGISQPDGEDEEASPLIEWEPLPSNDLIDSLLDRMHELRKNRQWETLVTAGDSDLQVLRKFWQEASTSGLDASSEYTLPYHLGLMIMLEPLWLRPARTWKRPQGDARTVFISLLEHLFVIYPVPRCLMEQVDWVGSSQTLKWLMWIILLGGGASLIRAGRRFGWWMNSALLEQLMQAPACLHPVHACIWAEVRRQGGTDVLAEALSGTEAFDLDPTWVSTQRVPVSEKRFFQEDSRTLGWYERYEGVGMLDGVYRRFFWQATLEWLVRHGRELSLEQISVILRWAEHENLEALRNREIASRQSRLTGVIRETALFSWKGRTLEATLRRAEQYHEAILRRKTSDNLQWQKHGWDWEWVDAAASLWRIRELTSSHELQDEGAAMSHCVGGYAYSCVNGHCCIFSLTKDTARVLTIELHLPDLWISQAHGTCNRQATMQEKSIVQRWHDEVVLKKHPIVADTNAS